MRVIAMVTGLSRTWLAQAAHCNQSSSNEVVRFCLTRKERENQTKMKDKVDGKAPGNESAEVQSPKRKVIRVESEETQD